MPFRIVHCPPAFLFVPSCRRSHKSVSKPRYYSTSTRPFPYPDHIPNPTPQQIFRLPFGASQQEIKSRYYELVRLHHPDSTQIRASLSSSSLTPELAHARFRSIKASYDFLSGRTLSPHPNSRPAHTPKHFDPHFHELARRRRAYYASRGASEAGRYDSTANEGDEWGTKTGWAGGFGAPKDQQGRWDADGWKERLILSFGVVVLLAGLFPTLPYTLASLLIPTEISSPSSTTTSPLTSNMSFLPDIYKNHRAAVSSLSQARRETSEVGAERREGVRKQVKEILRGGVCDADSNDQGSRDK